MRKKIVGFGEIMLRLSPPGFLKLIQTDILTANYTGAEANTLVSLHNFGYDTSFVTKVPDNDVAACAMATMRKYGVDVSKTVYGGERLGTYYSEKGASQRPSKVLYDRRYSSISTAVPEDFCWEKILEGADAFHFTGITAALGGALPEICLEACKTAKRKGAVVFCDLNYRKKLWPESRARQVMRELMPYVDVVMGNEEDSEKVLGIAPANSDVINGLSEQDYEEVAKKISESFGTKRVAFTLRTSISASENIWNGMVWEDGKACFSRPYRMNIVDRMGGGDSFGAGIIYSSLEGFDAQRSVDFAVAASCLKHSIELDFNLSSLEDVYQLMAGDGSGRIQR